MPGAAHWRLVVDGRFLLQEVTGVQRVAVEFVTTLDRLLRAGELPGLDVELVAPARGDLVSAPELQAVRLRRTGRLTGHAWEQLELPRVCDGRPLLCLGNVAPVRLLRDPDARVYTMVHDLSYRYHPEAYSRAFRTTYGTLMPIVLHRSTELFTVSVAERDKIHRHYPALAPGRLTVVQNGGGEGADTAYPSGAPAALRNGSDGVPDRRLRAPCFLYVGSLTRRKNAAGLLAAAVELVRERPFTFMFVGSTHGSFSHLGLTVPADVAPHIRFLGQVNDPAVLEQCYRRAAVFVFPSFHEASPLPPVEAMRFGCPVVAADIPSLRERCAEAVRYCDPHDVGSIVDRARELATVPSLWERQQQRGLQQAAGFTWATQVRTVLGRIARVETRRRLAHSG